jgi:hypothetical protein
MEGLLEALPRLARDAAVGVIVPAWWGVAPAMQMAAATAATVFVLICCIFGQTPSLR